MEKIRIKGGKSLSGRLHLFGAKNAALPLMASSLLTKATLTLNNLPNLVDINTMKKLLMHHGVKVNSPKGNSDGNTIKRTLNLSAENIGDLTAPYDLVRQMRASILVLGPLLARMGEANVSLPGGCAIGARPVDLHINGLEKLGAKFDFSGGYISAVAPKGLKGTHIVLPIVSVGATENLLMAACLAKGETIISNAAKEPEIRDLSNCLVAMGANIEGIGTDKLIIRGKTSLKGADYSIVGDRIEAGTYAIAAAITGGKIELTGVSIELLESVIEKLSEAGVSIEHTKQGFYIERKGKLKGIDVVTSPFPGFPTDLQAQITALMCIADGATMITEEIFENRFMHIPELVRMGANITMHGSSSLVRGGKLIGAPVMATDLRASACLILAGLAAKGETIVNRVYHIDRGYECIDERLSALGADIERLD